MTEGVEQGAYLLEPEFDPEGLERGEKRPWLHGRRACLETRDRIGLVALTVRWFGRRRGRRGGLRSSGELADEPGHRRLQFTAIDDQVHEAFLEQELGPLEPFWQLLLDRLFDHARAGKADERAGFGDVDVAEHREAGRHTACR